MERRSAERQTTCDDVAMITGGRVVPGVVRNISSDGAPVKVQGETGFLQADLGSRAGTEPGLIDLPATYALTGDGVDYCLRHSVPMRDVRIQDNRKALGFAWRRCRAAALQKLVTGRFLSSIVMTRPEFVSARAALMRFTGTVISGTIMGSFKSDIRLAVAAGSGISAATKREAGLPGAAASAGSVAEKRVALLTSLRASIAAESLAVAVREGAGQESGRTCEELVRAIDDESILLVARSGAALRRVAAEKVAAYARKMNVGEPLSLLLMEFIQLAEKSYLLNLAERDRYVRTHPEELPRLLAEQPFRERLLEAASRRGESMLLALDFARSAPGSSGNSDLAISMRTRGLIGYGPRDEAAGKRYKSVKRMSLDSLLRSAARGEQCAELGIAYYESLEAACRSESISFQTKVILDELKGETTLVLGVTA